MNGRQFSFFRTLPRTSTISDGCRPSATPGNVDVEECIRAASWEQLYRRDRLRYGMGPSQFARLLTPLLKSSEFAVHWGCGYGRDTQWLAEQLPTVCYLAVDYSETAISMFRSTMGERRIANIVPIVRDLLSSVTVRQRRADAIISHFFFHLFRERERLALLRTAHNNLAEGGLFAHSVFSAADSKFGNGRELEPGTFAPYEDRPWHYIHFFTREEIHETHASHGFDVERLEEFVEIERINGQITRSRSWFIVARRRKR